jgi:hypothetical protein
MLIRESKVNCPLQTTTGQGWYKLMGEWHTDMGINTSRTLNPTQVNINTIHKQQGSVPVHDERMIARMLFQVLGGLEIVFSGVNIKVAAFRKVGKIIFWRPMSLVLFLRLGLCWNCSWGCRMRSSVAVCLRMIRSVENLPWSDDLSVWTGRSGKSIGAERWIGWVAFN